MQNYCHCLYLLLAIVQCPTLTATTCVTFLNFSVFRQRIEATSSWSLHNEIAQESTYINQFKNELSSKVHPTAASQSTVIQSSLLSVVASIICKVLKSSVLLLPWVPKEQAMSTHRPQAKAGQSPGPLCSPCKDRQKMLATSLVVHL